MGADREAEKVSDRNMREVGGNYQYRRFAYLHKKDHEFFGLLLALDYKNAREHLGSRFHIRQTWLTEKEEDEQGFDRELRREIVYSIFLNPRSDAFIG